MLGTLHLGGSEKRADLQPLRFGTLPLKKIYKSFIILKSATVPNQECRSQECQSAEFKWLALLVSNWRKIMTREQAIQLIADALYGRAKETGILLGQADRGRGSYVRQAEYLLTHAEVQDEWNAHRFGLRMRCPAPGARNSNAFPQKKMVSSSH